MSLYEINHELLSLLNARTDAEGNLDEETEAAMAEHIAALSMAFDDKIDAYAALIQTCKSRGDARVSESRRMAALAESDKVLVARLQKAVLTAMTSTGKLAADTARFRVRVVKNGGVVPVIVHDADSLSPEYRVPVYSERVDTAALRLALERGDVIAGATLGERGTRLDIR